MNAGHNPPLYFSSDNFEILDKGGLMLGILNTGMEYETGKIKFSDKSTLVLYTDGVTEAQNKEKDEFGEDRLKKVIIDFKNENAEKTLNAISESVKEFTKGVNQYDDITLIVIKKNN